MKSEKEAWNHYRDYLAEALRVPETDLKPIIDDMRECVSLGCSRLELKEMMRTVFEPITIMQGLEQWLCQMDLLIFTGMKDLSGSSRAECFMNEDAETPYTMEHDTVLDDPSPETHIYDLSSITQDLLHAAAEVRDNTSPGLIQEIQKQTGLSRNWEIQMMLGDSYRQNNMHKKAIEIYESLADSNGHADPSINDAIMFTKYLQKNGSKVYDMEFKQVVDEYHAFAKRETFRRVSPKIQRNDPCPCGSGKKYKNCCGKYL